MRFKVFGISEDSGKETSIEVSAKTKELAHQKAYEKNLVIYPHKTIKVSKKASSNKKKKRYLITEKNAIRRLGQFGITAEDIKLEQAEISNRTGKDANYSDVYWSLCQKVILGQFALQEFTTIRMLYYDMALFLNKEGKDCQQWLLMANEAQLLEYQQSGFVSKVSISSGDWCCKACKKNRGKTITIIEAIKNKTLPHTNCSCEMHSGKMPFCQCMYLDIHDDETDLDYLDDMIETTRANEFSKAKSWVQSQLQSGEITSSEAKDKIDILKIQYGRKN